MMRKLQRLILKLARRGGLDSTLRGTSQTDIQSSTDGRQIRAFAVRDERALQETAVRKSAPAPEHIRYW